jgi:hypothetical protein
LSQNGLVSFESEVLLLRLRRSGWRLTMPTLVLTLVCFLYNAISGRFTENWHWYLAWALGGLILLVFWLIPLIRYANVWLEITTSRLVWRQGAFGKHQEISLHEVQTVESLRGGTIRVVAESGETIDLSGFSRPKAIAQAIKESIRG